MKVQKQLAKYNTEGLRIIRDRSKTLEAQTVNEVQGHHCTYIHELLDLLAQFVYSSSSHNGDPVDQDCWYAARNRCNSFGVWQPASIELDPRLVQKIITILDRSR